MSSDQVRGGARTSHQPSLGSRSEMESAFGSAHKSQSGTSKDSSVSALKRCLEREGFWDQLESKRRGKNLQRSVFRSVRPVDSQPFYSNRTVLSWEKPQRMVACMERVVARRIYGAFVVMLEHAAASR